MFVVMQSGRGKLTVRERRLANMETKKYVQNALQLSPFGASSMGLTSLKCCSVFHIVKLSGKTAKTFHTLF